MSASQHLRTATAENDRAVFQHYKQHASGTRIETKQNVLNIIRDAYQDYHVTIVDAGNCSLLEFAAAGKAKVIFDVEDETFNVTREWKPVGSGIEKKTHPGKLNDSNHFAR